VLEAVRNSPSVRTVVYVTSDKCYRNKEWIWGYRENDELGGHDPYSASKAAAELVFSSYCDSFFFDRPTLGVASVRAGNVIGGGDQSLDRIVPDTIRALQSGAPIVLRSPESTRPWQHVLEPLSGYIALAVKLSHEPQTFSGSWNFGPEVEAIHTVVELAEKLVKEWGSGSIQVRAPQKAPHEAGLLQLNIDKARQQLHWSPQWGFDTAVERIVSWHKEVDAGQPAYDVTLAQIDEYSRAAFRC
jgi:CDP-glucose 4,6-dehydratase